MEFLPSGRFVNPSLTFVDRFGAVPRCCLPQLPAQQRILRLVSECLAPDGQGVHAQALQSQGLAVERLGLGSGHGLGCVRVVPCIQVAQHGSKVKASWEFSNASTK